MSSNCGCRCGGLGLAVDRKFMWGHGVLCDMLEKPSKNIPKKRRTKGMNILQEAKDYLLWYHVKIKDETKNCNRENCGEIK